MKKKTKICSNPNCEFAGQEQLIENFHKDKTHKDGLRSQCKKCDMNKARVYYQKNKEKIKRYVKEHRKEYDQKNKEKIREHRKIYIENNLEKIKEQNREYRRKNREEIHRRQAEYRNKNRERINTRKNELKRQRRRNNPLIRLKDNLRKRTWQAFKDISNASKNKHTFELVGCTPEFLKKYIEKKFLPGMTWDNYGEWHVDHIVALSKAVTKEALEGLCHYTNLQPLWGPDNLSKGAK